MFELSWPQRNNRIDEFSTLNMHKIWYINQLCDQLCGAGVFLAENLRPRPLVAGIMIFLHGHAFPSREA